jgi:hypothetical protein
MIAIALRHTPGAAGKGMIAAVDLALTLFSLEGWPPDREAADSIRPARATCELRSGVSAFARPHSMRVPEGGLRTVHPNDRKVQA